MSVSHATTSVRLSCASAPLERGEAGGADPRCHEKVPAADPCAHVRLPQSVISSDQKKMFFGRSR